MMQNNIKDVFKVMVNGEMRVWERLSELEGGSRTEAVPELFPLPGGQFFKLV